MICITKIVGVFYKRKIKHWNQFLIWVAGAMENYVLKSVFDLVARAMACWLLGWTHESTRWFGFDECLNPLQEHLWSWDWEKMHRICRLFSCLMPYVQLFDMHTRAATELWRFFWCIKVAVVGPMVTSQREKPGKSWSEDLLFSYRR